MLTEAQETIRQRNLKSSTRNLEIAKEGVDLLDRLSEHVPLASLKRYNVSIVRNMNTRFLAAKEKVHFWNDAAVEMWMSGRPL